MNEYLIHYEEYGDNDLQIIITPQIMTKYFNEMGYSYSKSMVIVGALEKFTFTQTKGFAKLVDGDARFYDWAKELNRKQAKFEFGYADHIVAFVDSFGEYREVLCVSEAEAIGEFEKAMENDYPCAIYRQKQKNRGWNATPVKKYKFEKIDWKFWRRHKNRHNP